MGDEEIPILSSSLLYSKPRQFITGIIKYLGVSLRYLGDLEKLIIILITPIEVFFFILEEYPTSREFVLHLTVFSEATKQVLLVIQLPPVVPTVFWGAK